MSNQTKSEVTQVVYNFDIKSVSPDAAYAYARQHMNIAGYTDPDEVSDDHYHIMAMGVGFFSNASPWSRGDIMLAIRERKGIGFSDTDLAPWADLFRCSTARLRNNITTARNWDKERRVKDSKVIGYSHHELLNPFSLDEQNEFIELAESQSMGYTSFEKHIKQVRQGRPDSNFVPAEAPALDYDALEEKFLAERSAQASEGDELPGENSFNSLGTESIAPKTAKDDGDIERMADALSGSRSAYSWSGEEPIEDRAGIRFVLAHDPIAAASQFLSLMENGNINAGWLAIFMTAINDKVEIIYQNSFTIILSIRYF